MADQDGNVYHYQNVSTQMGGTEIWTIEPLSAKHYRNGDPIPEIEDSALWVNTTTGAYCYYSNNESLVVLYNWYAINDSRGICPLGWHVPTSSDATEIPYLSGNLFGYRSMQKGFTGEGEISYYWTTTNYLGSYNAAWCFYTVFNDPNLYSSVLPVNSGACVRLVKD
jgi:hypothetical protein